MSELININIGEMAVGHNDTRIKTGSIGSCMVIVLYDDIAKVGGMAHAMLPTRNEHDKNAISAAKYTDEAVNSLLSKIKAIGGKKEMIKAKLVGGSRMFKILSGDKYGIGYQNIESARKRLAELGIPIASEDTGGTIGRIAELDLRNGLINVSTKM